MWHPISTVLLSLSRLANQFWAVRGLRDLYWPGLFGLQAMETQFQLACVMGEALRVVYKIKAIAAGTRASGTETGAWMLLEHSLLLGPSLLVSA